MRHRHTPRKCNLVLIALGGNLEGQRDSPIAQVVGAIQMILQARLGVKSISRLWRTPAFPAGSGPDFVNAALACVNDLTPQILLSTLHEIEAEAGRARHKRWGPRVIDLDLLAVGDLVLPDREEFSAWADLPLEAQMERAPEHLILPHPRMQDRGFVLAPLMDIAPDWHHPVLGRTVAQMHAALPPEALAEIVPISREIHDDLLQHGLSYEAERSKDGA